MIDCIIKPEFTKKQIAECKKCKHASAKIKWCGKHGVPIGEPSRIIVPDKTVKLPSKLSMAGSFAKAAGKFIAAGASCRSEPEQAKLKAICSACKQPSGEPMLFMDPRKGPRCRMCGCCTNVKTLWATAHCPLDKW